MKRIKKSVLLSLVLLCAAATLLVSRAPCKAAQEPVFVKYGEWRAGFETKAGETVPLMSLRNRKGKKILPTLSLYTREGVVKPLLRVIVLGKKINLPQINTNTEFRVDDNEPHRPNAQVVPARSFPHTMLDFAPQEAFIDELFAGKTLHIRVESPDGAVVRESIPLDGFRETWETILVGSPKLLANAEIYGYWSLTRTGGESDTTPTVEFHSLDGKKLFPSFSPYRAKNSATAMMGVHIRKKLSSSVKGGGEVLLRIDDNAPYSHKAEFTPTHLAAFSRLRLFPEEAFFKEILVGTTLRVQVTLHDGSMAEDAFPLNGFREAWEQAETSLPESLPEYLTTPVNHGEWVSVFSNGVSFAASAKMFQNVKRTKTIPIVYLPSERGPVAPVLRVFLPGAEASLVQKCDAVSLRVDDNEPRRFAVKALPPILSEDPTLEVAAEDAFFTELRAGKTLHIRIELHDGSVIQESSSLDGFPEACERAASLAPQKPSTSKMHGSWESLLLDGWDFAASAVRFQRTKEKKIHPLFAFQRTPNSFTGLTRIAFWGEDSPSFKGDGEVSLRVDGNKPYKYNDNVVPMRPSYPPFLDIAMEGAFFEELLAGKTLHIQVALSNGAARQESFPLDGFFEAWERAAHLLIEAASQDSAKNAPGADPAGK